MSRECPLCHERLCDDAPEANPKLAGRLVPTDEWPPTVAGMSTGLRDVMCAELAAAEATVRGMERRDFDWFAATRPAPLYRVTWGRGPTRTMPMPWPRVLSFVRAARRARPGLPITVERAPVPQSPTHPEEPR